MAPYSPPTGDRLDKLRLDFNENTVGCSPRVIECLQRNSRCRSAHRLSRLRRAKTALAAHFRVSPDELLLTNGTDEAIQVLINTYVDDGDEVIVLRPSYAMYRFYAEVAGAKIVEVDYQPPALAFPLRGTARRHHTAHPRHPDRESQQSDRHRRSISPASKKSSKAAPHAAVLIDEAYYEFFGVTALSLIWKYPQLFVSRTFSKVYGMAALRMGCLFSQAANIKYLHKAQSPYSVNMLAAIAAEAAVADTEYIENYVTEALAAREMLELGLEKLGIGYVRGLGQLRPRLLRRPRRRNPRRSARKSHPGARPQL